MDDDERAVLISVRPRYAEAIVRAEKTVELRRTRINVPIGTHLLIYSTSPVMAVIGTAVLDRVEVDAPERLWTRVSNSAGIGRNDYKAYFEGAKEAVALHLRAPRPLATPISLAQLRTVVGVEPSQSFRYLDVSQAKLIAPAVLSG